MESRLWSKDESNIRLQMYWIDENKENSGQNNGYNRKQCVEQPEQRPEKANNGSKSWNIVV